MGIHKTGYEQMRGEFYLFAGINRACGFRGRKHGEDASIGDRDGMVFEDSVGLDGRYPSRPHQKLSFHCPIIMVTVSSMDSAESVTRSAKERSPAIRWTGRRLELLDQRRLPDETTYVTCCTAADVASAISAMVVRGAPAIGIAAAYGVALSARRMAELPLELRPSAIEADFKMLAEARPTAVNLAWALARLRPLAEEGAGFSVMAAAAEEIHAEDVATNRTLAVLGSQIIGTDARLLTHCNTGPLATGGIGTAFGVIAAVWRAGHAKDIYFTETRPWLQGARLSAWEFARLEISATLMTDLAAAGLALSGGIDWLVVGADRIAANGDTVNKVGTAVLAAATRRGGGQVMVVAPYATVDPALASGAEVPIETRQGDELWRAAARGQPPPGIEIANPVFDVTCARSIDLIVTERGSVSPMRGETPMALKDAVMLKFNR